MDAAKAAGVPWITLATGWAAVQPTADAVPGPDGAGGAAWRQLEQRLRYAHSIGLKTFVQFTGAPAWATDGRPANAKGNVPPRPDALPAYAAFFDAVARGLGPWIDAYSPWNEVNQPDFWDREDPVLFAQLQRAVYPAIKNADPSALVVSGTVYSKDGSFDFLRRAYAAGLRGGFDVVGWMLFPAVEPESPPRPGQGFPQRNLSSILDLQGLLAELDPGRRIWVVEYSYSTCEPRPGRAFCVSEAQQADYLTRAFTYMRRYLDVERLFWFSLRDKEVRDIIEANYGLLRFDFSEKPAYSALRALRVEVPGGAAGPPPGGVPPPALPARAARAPDPASFAAGGARVALGRPKLTLRRGRVTLAVGVTVRGGRVRVAVQGFRAGRWRPIASVRLARSSRLTVRFRDRGYLAIRLRATRPGTSTWAVSRVVRAPGVRVARARAGAARGAAIRLTAGQLRINQRIGQAAVRRLNALRARLEGRPAPAGRAARPGTVALTARQLRINQRIYQAAVRRANALEARLEGRRPPAAAGGGSRGAVRLSAGQLRINQRIAQAAVRRAGTLAARVPA
ncbi:glycoside hydrolase family protein [Miltoncostaea marina]|uniref:glycoside hydrolase family protein n=1 Tax=Miltoncostaea marina TaxID=2843215 RepID=UPI001C3D5AEF|nr:glycoside hydrolase family protein [Miltoncostaea marina]